MINPRISEFETTKNKLRAYKIKLKFVEVSERWRHERQITDIYAEIMLTCFQS